jgi:hypothetical protein
MPYLFTTLLYSAALVALTNVEGAPPADPNVPMFVTEYDNPTCSATPEHFNDFVFPSNLCVSLGPGTLIVSGPGGSSGHTSVFLSCVGDASIPVFDTEDCVGPPTKVYPKINGDIKAYCIHDAEASLKVSCRAPGADCRPNYKTNIKNCDKLIRKCGTGPLGGLKWVGRGCRNKKGERFRDGGCQCIGFCGYACEGKCRADVECAWNATMNACTVKGTDVPAGPIPFCVPIPPISGGGR